MKKIKLKMALALMLALGLPLIIAPNAFAQSAGGGDVSNIENFIKNIIQILAGLAGLIATGFFVVGGYGYITSSGEPEKMDRAKRTIIWSAVGLAITIGAFVLSNIIADAASKAFGS